MENLLQSETNLIDFAVHTRGTLKNEGSYYNNEYIHFIMYCLGFLQHDTLSCACGPGLGLEMDESC